jgi:transglutaminase-like putative cysteine protease
VELELVNMICESEKSDDYLLELDEVNYSNPIIGAKVNELFNHSQTEIEKAKIAFEFVRDEISHTWDIQGKRVTCNASDVLVYKEGICYAKSNLLASLLRSQGIPTGFCYQRLMLFDTPEKGYCIHALNAVFFKIT